MLSLKNYLFIILGSIFLAFGVIGIVIPVLPTTPFLLLASFFYLRSSKRMYQWLINHKILGIYIYCYLSYKAIPKKSKVVSIIFLWSTLICSMYLIPFWHFRIFLIVVGIGVTIHLMTLKTLSHDDMKKIATDSRK